MKYHLTPVRTVILKNRQTRDNKAGKDVEKREPLYSAGGNVNWYSHYGEQYGISSQNKKQNYHMIQQSQFEVFIQRR